MFAFNCNLNNGIVYSNIFNWSYKYLITTAPCENVDYIKYIKTLIWGLQINNLEK